MAQRDGIWVLSLIPVGKIDLSSLDVPQWSWIYIPVFNFHPFKRVYLYSRRGNIFPEGQTKRSREYLAGTFNERNDRATLVLPA